MCYMYSVFQKLISFLKKKLNSSFNKDSEKTLYVRTCLILSVSMFEGQILFPNT
jgi:hypothetical protein